MKIEINIPKTELAQEGTQAATMKSIKPKGEGKCRIEFDIVVDGSPFVVGKDYPKRMDASSPLLKDAETIRGEKFVAGTSNVEFDLETLVGKKCQVFVEHRRSNGGRMVAAVSNVMPALKTA